MVKVCWTCYLLTKQVCHAQLVPMNPVQLMLMSQSAFACNATCAHTTCAHMVLQCRTGYSTGAIGPVRVADPCAAFDCTHGPCYVLLTETVSQASKHFACPYTPEQR